MTVTSALNTSVSDLSWSIFHSICTSVKDLNTSSTLLLRTEMFACAQTSHEVSRWHCLPFKHGKHLDVSHRLSLLLFLSLFPFSAFVSLFLSFTFSFPTSRFSPSVYPLWADGGFSRGPQRASSRASSFQQRWDGLVSCGEFFVAKELLFQVKLILCSILFKIVACYFHNGFIRVVNGELMKTQSTDSMWNIRGWCFIGDCFAHENFSSWSALTGFKH